MARPRSAKVDLGVYLAIRLVVCLLQGLPVPAVRKIATFLAWLAFHVDKRHREVARENLRHAFPEKCSDPVECDRMVRACYHHFCTMVVEMILLPRKLHPGNFRERISIVGGSRMMSHLLGDRPLLMITGHFGNWEMAGFTLGIFGFRTYAIARTLDNPHLEAFFRKFRQKTGQTILAKKGDFDNITGILANGGAIATLADQDAGPRGQFVQFFGRPASTHKAVALLALEYNVPMIVVGMPRIAEPMQYQIVIEELIFPEDFAHRPDAVKAITEQYTAALERLIRRHPEQYFWLHRRWKHQPAVRGAKKAA